MMTFLSGHKFMLVFLTLTTAFSHIIITDDSLKIMSHYIGKILLSKKHSCILSHLLVMICLLLIILLMFFRDLN